MIQYNPRKCSAPPHSPALQQAVRHTLSPARVAGGLLAVSLAGLTPQALALELELANLNGSNGFMLNGINIYDSSGLSVSKAGDVNGDGVDDLIIGAPRADPGGRTDAGQSYVVFGTQAGFPAALELATLNGANGFMLNGINAGDYAGQSVSGIGDINGDGIDDLLIGAPFADPGGRTDAGQGYVVFGTQAGFPAALELATLNGANGVMLNGIQDLDNTGWSVSGAGDINGDGITDLLIGARNADPDGRTDAGRSYVVFGTQAGVPAALELATLNGTNGFMLNGINASDQAGYWVSDARDINGDGVADLLIGAPFADPGGRTDAGQSYVVLGNRAGFSATLELGALNGTNGVMLNGINAGDRAGNSVSGAGDVNGDGINDLIIGALSADPDGRINAGQSYVVFGAQADFSSVLELAALNGANGFRLNGVSAYDYSGDWVSSAGDVNGDGLDDLIISAHVADPGGRTDAGQSYVVLGNRAGFPPILELADLGDGTGVKINGIQSFDRAGRVSGAGDINGDGVDDILIGAIGADPGGRTSAGQSYVVFGVDASPAPLTTVGLYDPAASGFYLRNSLAGGPADTSFRFGPGGLGWLPLTGDWSGDGTTTVGLYNPVNGTFFLKNSLAGGPADTSFRFGPGGLGWQPLTGDWDGDGITTVGLYNPVNGTFFLKNSLAGGPADASFRFGPGGLGWQPLTGDWDGNGTDTVGLYDPANSSFFLKNSHAGGAADASFRFGPRGLEWLPIMGDWNADGTTTIGLYDPANGGFHVRNSLTGGPADASFRFGPRGLGWLPITGHWGGP